MGLDSYIYSIPASLLPDEDCFDCDENPTRVNFLYYDYQMEHLYLRKNWDFHEFMYEISKQKGSEYSSSEFNGIIVKLTLEDITLIEEKYKHDEIIMYSLPEIKRRLKDPKIAVFYDSRW